MRLSSRLNKFGQKKFNSLNFKVFYLLRGETLKLILFVTLILSQFKSK